LITVVVPALLVGMYLRTTQRRNRDGSVVRYIQLAHNQRVGGVTQARVLANLGREDQLDRDGVRRLVASINRYLGEPNTAATDSAELVGDGLTVAGSRPVGAVHLLDGLWRALDVDAALRKVVGARRFTTDVERVLFALVANRAIEPKSKLSAAEWAVCDVAIDGLAAMDEDQAYRAMDLLAEADAQAEVQEAVFFAVADLLNLEVDLLFFDTTSTYFERDTEEAGEDAFRVYGHSKDHRNDLPQIVIGLAVTREGIPVRVWCWPGSTADSALIRQVKKDMRDWSLGRVVWVADRGFTSKANRKFLQQGGGGYIIGEKLRSGSAEAAAALSRQGRYKTVAGNLQVKEVRLADAGDRFIVCFNPDQAVRDAAVRAKMISQLEDLIAGGDKLSITKRAELRGKIFTMPGPNRFLRVTPGGLLRVDLGKAKAEENLDGKYLLRSADPHMTADDIAAGYKQLLEVERSWRDMKSVLDLRPVYHPLEERIRAHVILCWLALLLIRVAENTASQTWPAMRRELQRIAIGTFTSPAGTFRQRTDIPKTTRGLLTALNIDVPRKIHELTTPET
jgi:hypothetical protein